MSGHGCPRSVEAGGDTDVVWFAIERFWGWTENAREQAMDHAELSARTRAGKPIYGESDVDEFTQGVAASNSTFSQLKFGAMPW